MRRALPLLLAALSCAPRPGAVPGHEPPSGAKGWVAPLHRDHPLVGRVYDVRGVRWIDAAALVDAARGADLLLLGENHDHPDHHLLQAWLLQAVAAAGRRPAVAFEMLTSDLQPALDAAVATPAPTADGVRPVWQAGGWPDFDLYRPILDVALASRLPLVAANLPRDEAREIVRKGRAAIPPALAGRLARDEPVPEALQAKLRQDMADEHCGALPEVMLDPMVLAQRARDAQMAARVEGAAGPGGAALVTGSGHARTDRGVPAHLARDAPERSRLSIAFLEVTPRRLEPGAYAADWGTSTLPFDLVVFTPGVDRGDPCAGLREKAKATPGAPGGRP